MNTAIWQPKHPENTRMWAFMRFVEQRYGQTCLTYHDLHTWSTQQPACFWEALCKFFNINFSSPYLHVLNQYKTMLDARWFEGATLNFAQKLLSRTDNHTAIISLDERGQRRVLTYRELYEQVSFCAAGLKKAGVKTFDRVACVMPNVSYTIIAMLATASIGAIWSSCSTDFGASAVVERLGQINPRVLFVCDGHDYHGKTHLEFTKIKSICEQIQSIQTIVFCPIIGAPVNLSELNGGITWDDFLIPEKHLDFTQLPFNHPLYILFSSGTTGKPKCIVHGAGGTLLQHVKELGLHTDLHALDNLFFYTTCGWMMWNWMVSALALGATLTLYEGAPFYPEAHRLFQLLSDEHVTVFGTSPKFMATLEQSGFHPAKHNPLPHLRCILSTGSPLLSEQYDFINTHVKPGVQISSISGGTDIVSCFALGNPLAPVYRGELQCLGLGMAMAIYDEQGQACTKTRGELVCTKPFPSMPIAFWNDEDKTHYKKAYFSRFPDVWAHGDFAEITAHNGLIIYGRSDAVLNPGGVRIGTAEIYRPLEKIPEIIDSVVIGQPYQGDVRVVLFVKLAPEHGLDKTLETTIRQTIRAATSPRHVPAVILQVGDIPRTRSGKLVEVAVRQAVMGEKIANLQSLANPEALEYFKNSV